MKALSLNTWQERGPWERRWEIIFEEIDREKPDLVAFQEVFQRSWAEEVRKRTALPLLINSGEPSGLIFLTRFSLRRRATLVMRTQSPTESYRRYALFAELDTGRGGRLSVFNTHLSWQLDEGPVREMQVGELLQFIKEEASGPDTVVMGDFNATPASGEINQMTQEGNFVDAFGHLYPGVAGLTWTNENDYARSSSHPLPDRRIDYLFIPKDSQMLKELVSIKVVMDQPREGGLWASDHFGLLAEFHGGDL